MLALSTLAIGAASLFAVVAANHGQISRSHHHNPLLERSEAHLQKRFGGQATYYAVGLGACGQYSSPGDYIVALNSAQYGGGYPGPNCFRSIQICKGDKCANAKIMDECPTCAYGCLDLSEGLFKHFASTDDGVFQMSWSFTDDSDPEPTKKPDPPKTTEKPDPPKTTKKPDPPKTTKEPEPEPEPTTSSKKPKPTTTSQPETTSTPEPTTTSSTTTSSIPETTSTSQAEITTTTSAVSSSVSPSATPGSGSGASGSNWADMAQIMLAMGRMATAAHSN